MRTSCINPCFYPLLNSRALASAKQIAFINFYYGILARLMAINCYLLHMLCVATLAVVVVVAAASIAAVVVVTGSCWSARDYLERATSAKCQYIFISLEILHICNTHTKTGQHRQARQKAENEMEGELREEACGNCVGNQFYKIEFILPALQATQGSYEQAMLSCSKSVCVCGSMSM